MNKDQARERIEQLRQEIQRHRELYYRQARPEITDAQYDALEQELVALEAAYPDLASATSPTVQVGDDRAPELPSRRHSRPMLSLQNSYDLDDVAAFVQRSEREVAASGPVIFTIEAKLDGVAIAVRYRDGKLDCALTRGDGREGDVVTAAAATLADLPARLPEHWPEAFTAPVTACTLSSWTHTRRSTNCRIGWRPSMSMARRSMA